MPLSKRDPANLMDMLEASEESNVFLEQDLEVYDTCSRQRMYWIGERH